MRSLIQFYNKRHYSSFLAPPPQPDIGHKRTMSTTGVMLDDPVAHHRAASTTDHDVFPPRRTGADQMPYNPDGMIEFWLHEYEDVLSEVFGDPDVHVPYTEAHSDEDEPEHEGRDRVAAGQMALDDIAAWRRLGEIMRGGREEEEISDSESVASIGELGDEARMDGAGATDAREGHQGENTWEVSLQGEACATGRDEWG